MSSFRLLRVSCGWLALSLVLQFAPTRVNAQGLLGRVRDAATRAPISAVQLTLYALDGRPAARAITDDSGRFILKTDRAGPYRVVTAHIGYAEVTLGPVQLEHALMMEADIHLTVSAVKVEAVLVTSERTDAALRNAGYYARKKLGFGKFLDPEQIAVRQAAKMNQVLQGVPGVRIMPMPNGKFTVAVRGGPAGFCIAAVYLNGLAQPRFDWDQINPTEVAAVEVYRSGLEVPGQFANHANDCGAVIIWLKR